MKAYELIRECPEAVGKFFAGSVAYGITSAMVTLLPGDTRSNPAAGASRSLRPSNDLSTQSKRCVWKRLLRFDSARHYPPGGEIFRQGEVLHQVFLLERGIVKITCDTVDGQPVVVELRVAGQWLQEGVDLFTPGRSHEFSAFAVTECDVWRHDASAFRQTLRTRNEITKAMLEEVADQARQRALALLELKTLSPVRRARRLMKLLHSGGDRARPYVPSLCRLALSQAEAAQLLGLSCRQLRRIVSLSELLSKRVR